MRGLGEVGWWGWGVWGRKEVGWVRGKGGRGRGIGRGIGIGIGRGKREAGEKKSRRKQITVEEHGRVMGNEEYRYEAKVCTEGSVQFALDRNHMIFAFIIKPLPKQLH